jgi:hypothetical protein
LCYVSATSDGHPEATVGGVDGARGTVSITALPCLVRGDRLFNSWYLLISNVEMELTTISAVSGL